MAVFPDQRSAPCLFITTRNTGRTKSRNDDSARQKYRHLRPAISVFVVLTYLTFHCIIPDEHICLLDVPYGLCQFDCTSSGRKWIDDAGEKP